jgi:hypothetical protein
VTHLAIEYIIDTISLAPCHPTISHERKRGHSHGITDGFRYNENKSIIHFKSYQVSSVLEVGLGNCLALVYELLTSKCSKPK